MEGAFIIKGLAGKKKLEGEIPVRGAKNASLKLLAAGLLFEDSLVIHNAPIIEDMERMKELLSALGGEVRSLGVGKIKLDFSHPISPDIPSEISEKFRASIVAAGPLLARLGRVSFSLPGGCHIGKRPIDFFIEGFEEMGAKVRVSGEENRVRYLIEAPAGRLKGTEIYLRAPSVTGTETLLMTAILAEGRTVIKNAAMEPEVVSLATFLRQCGARIWGEGTPTITIEGGTLLRSKGLAYETIPDRIEAGSFIILAALAGKDVNITHCDPSHLDSLLSLLHHAGVEMKIGKDSVRITDFNKVPRPLKAFSIKTQGYPGFPTDLQALITLFLTQAQGSGSVFETIFESRLAYIDALNSMGAKIKNTGNQAFTEGPTPLLADNLASTDLRAGMAFLLAAIIAKGESRVENIYNIDRGYEKIEDRLSNIGVQIKRVLC